MISGGGGVGSGKRTYSSFHIELMGIPLQDEKCFPIYTTSKTVFDLIVGIHDPLMGLIVLAFIWID
jgi:hypothetical protein